MPKWLWAFFFWDRRKQAEPVAVERRQRRVTAKAANDQLCASIDRFNRTIVRKREDMLK